MSTNPDHYRPRESASGSQLYLDATIRTASPARLRLMMIERACQVTETLAGCWRREEMLGANEHSLKLLELLNELLGGVTGGSTEVENKTCLQVADLYVFLVQHLVAAEGSSDASAIDEIGLVLQTEAETWRMVCANEMPTTAPPAPAQKQAARAPASLNFEA